MKAWKRAGLAWGNSAVVRLGGRLNSNLERVPKTASSGPRGAGWLGHNTQEFLECQWLCIGDLIVSDILVKSSSRAESPGQFSAFCVLLEGVQEDSAFWGSPLSVCALEDNRLPDLLARSIDDEVSFVPRLILDHTVNTPILDPLVAELDDNFVVLRFGVLQEGGLAVGAGAFVGKRHGGDEQDQEDENSFHFFTSIANGSVRIFPFQLNWA